MAGAVTGGRDRRWLTVRGALRVPQITAAFWITKGLSTALGESTSDYSVHAIAPQQWLALSANP